MVYQVLARKWRPADFSDVVGQDHVVRALTHALNNNRLHHAYLLTGTRGVGKTTLARIIAKALNCEQGISATPCSRCQSCMNITEGRFVDLVEVDAASRTKVEDTRDLLENIHYAPSQGRYKVYIIDEVHMLSNHSFNALLKTLEEPPEHVKFLLATTDPQRLPITILSRCLQFHLKNVSANKISERLAHILQEEAISFEYPALLILAQAAAGSLRDGLSLLDQAISFGGGKVSIADVNLMLGNIASDYIYDLLQALINNHGSKLLDTVAAMAEYNIDFSQALENFLSLLHQLAIIQLIPKAIDATENHKEQLIHLSQLIKPADIQLYYQIGLLGQRDLPLISDTRCGFEMILLRMLAFKPDTIIEPISSRLNQAKAVPPDAFTSNLVGQNSSKPIMIDPSVSSENLTSIQEAKTVTGQIIDWSDLLTQLNLTGLADALAKQCVMVSFTGNDLHLHLDPKYQSSLSQSIKERLTKALSEYFKTPIKLTISLVTPASATPAIIEEKKQREEHIEAVKILAKDPNVKTIINLFEAQLKPESVKIVDSN